MGEGCLAEEAHERYWLSQKTDAEREALFLKELSKLSRKYGVVVQGCGCCGSPYLSAKRSSGLEAGAYIPGYHDPIDWDEEYKT